MFIWLLILVEIIILSSVFWFVYFYKPAPRRMKSTIWGSYNNERTAEERYLLLSDDFNNGMIIESKERKRGTNNTPNVIPIHHPDAPHKHSA